MTLSWIAVWPLDSPVVTWVALVVVGVVAAVINSIAGGGSFLVLPVLMAAGLPPSVANGTVRVGVVFSCVTSALTFQSKGLLDWKKLLPIAPGMVLGAWIGAELANSLEEEWLRTSFGLVLVAWAVVLLLRPGRFLEAREEAREEARGMGVAGHAMALAIGVYGGFIQAGVGFPLMALLIYWLGMDALRGNAIKVALVLVFTVPAFAVFLRDGNIAWLEAGALVLGNMIGGWAGTRWQIRAGVKLIRVFVVVMVTISGVLLLLG